MHRQNQQKNYHPVTESTVRGDDAAGLKISEKMRSQVRGLNRASTNAQDGVSLIQTAEGALNEAHSILQRMNELAVQGANDTNENIDREAINEELDALTTELDRISSTTQFNKQNLLDGSFKNKKLQVGANADQNIEISIGSMNAKTLGLKDVSGTIEKTAQEGVKPVAIKYQGMSYIYRPKSSLDKNTDSAISDFKKQLSGKYTSANYAAQFENGKVFYKSLVNDNTYSTVSKAVAVMSQLQNRQCLQMLRKTSTHTFRQVLLQQKHYPAIHRTETQELILMRWQTTPSQQFRMQLTKYLHRDLLLVHYRTV